MADAAQLFARFGRRCPAGTVLFREGEEGDTMYVVHSGRVRITKQGHDGVKTLAVLGPGEFFGEMAILNQKPRTATSEVIEDATVLVIDARTFEQMVIENTEIAVRLIRKLARRLDSSDALINVLMHREAKARVLLGLAREAEFHGDLREDGAIVVALDRDALAEQVGVDPGEVRRLVTRLLRLGILEDAPGGFAIPDVARLHDFLDYLEAREKPGNA